MSSGFEVYQVFQAIRLHFTSDSYDYFKYSGKTRVSEENFETRKDKYIYYKLGRNYDANTLPYFFAVNYALRDKKLWIRDFLQEEAVTTYETWIKWQQARSYNFTSDLSRLNDLNFSELIKSKDGQFPDLLNMVFQKELSYDTLIILDHYIHLMDVWSKKIVDDFIWSGFHTKAKKYIPFFLHYAPLDDTQYKKLIVNGLTVNR